MLSFFIHLLSFPCDAIKGTTIETIAARDAELTVDGA